MQNLDQEITIKNVDDFLISIGYEEDYKERYQETEEDDHGEETVFEEERIYKKDGICIKIKRNQDALYFDAYSEDWFFRYKNSDTIVKRIRCLKSFKETIIILSNIECFSKKVLRIEKNIASINKVIKDDYYKFLYRIDDCCSFSIRPELLIEQCFIHFSFWENKNKKPINSFSILFHVDDSDKIEEIIKCLNKISETMDISYAKKMLFPYS